MACHMDTMLLCTFTCLHALISGFLAVNTPLPPLYKIWDTRRVPYTISSQLDDEIQTTVRSAIATLQQATCVRFESKTEYDFDYLHIAPGPDCETWVGRRGGEQILQIDSNCASNAYKVVHELLHTLGFYHEHQRLNRDQYLSVYLDNVLQSKIESNFLKKRAFLSSLNNLAYDYSSLTHYGQNTFSKSSSLPTLATIDPAKQSLIGQRDHISDLDIQKVKMYYNCVNTPMLTTCSTTLPQLQHGTWSTVQGQEGTVGNVVEYSCNSRYTLIGPKARGCLLDGSWLAYSPYCIDTPVMYCNFGEYNSALENKTWCSWTASYEGVSTGYWYLNRGGTADTQTGPSNDYTTMMARGYYAYVDSSRAGVNDVAILTSPVVRTSAAPTCLRFSYSMFGQWIGQLCAYVLLDSATASQIWCKNGGQGPDWMNETISNIPADSAALQIQFRLTMTGSNKGDIAQDDILLTECNKLLP